MIVLDCSVVMAWCSPEAGSVYANGILSRLNDETVLVPALWPLEVANALLVSEKRKRLSDADVSRLMGEISSLPVRMEHPITTQDLPKLTALAREYGLTSYDAAYLELAMRKGAALATLDEDLRKAAKKAGVKLAA